MLSTETIGALRPKGVWSKRIHEAQGAELSPGASCGWRRAERKAARPPACPPARLPAPSQATLSDRGLRVLERGFLPTLDKFGKKCVLLFGPEDVHLIQTSLDADGLQITARLALVGAGPARTQRSTARPGAASAMHSGTAASAPFRPQLTKALYQAAWQRRPARSSTLVLRPPKQDVLFEPGQYKVVSKHHNLIAFSVDIALMIKVCG